MFKIIIMKYIQAITTHLLKRTFFLFCALVFSQASFSQEDDKPRNDTLDAIVSPDLERRIITEDQLDSEDWEIGVYGGVLNIEEFDSNFVYGLRLAYHMTESIVLELNLGTSEVGDSFQESLDGGLVLTTEEDRQYEYYNISFAYNLLPGEIFLGSKTAYKTDFYIVGGVGNTTFNSDDFFTYSFGGGLRFYFTDAIALHATVKDHIYDSDVVTVQQVHNIESTLGLSFYF